MLRIGKKPIYQSTVVLGDKPRGPALTLGRKPIPQTRGTRRIAQGPTLPKPRTESTYATPIGLAKPR